MSLPKNMPLPVVQDVAEKAMDEALRGRAALAGSIMGMVYLVANLVRDLDGVGSISAHNIRSGIKARIDAELPPIESAERALQGDIGTIPLEMEYQRQELRFLEMIMQELAPAPNVSPIKPPRRKLTVIARGGVN